MLVTNLSVNADIEEQALQFNAQTPTHSHFDDSSQMSGNQPVLHVSQSHTNLLLVDSASDFGGESSVEERPPQQPRKKLNLSILLDPSLIASVAESHGNPLEAVDGQLQAIKVLLDSTCSKYTGEWDSILEDCAQSLFHSLGGWRALILKLHQIIAGILLPYRSTSDSIWSNAWETTSLLSHISRMKVNPGRVQESLSSIHKIEASLPLVSVAFKESASHESSAKIRCSVDLQVLWYCVQCCGRFDVYLQSMLASQLSSQLPAIHSLSLGQSWEIATTVGNKAIEVYKAAQFRHRLFAEQYDWYLLMLSQEGSSEGVEATLKDIETDLRYSNLNPCDVSARKRIERLLVHMIGHSSESVRSTAVRLMNRYYDSHDWQRDSPFERVSVLTVGEDLVIQVKDLNLYASAHTDQLSIELVAPSMSPEPHQRDSLTRYHIDGSCKEIRFPNVVRSGFYDYRVTKLTSTGWRQVREPASNKPVMGRFIVQARNARQLQVCSMLVDEVDGEQDEITGLFETRRGSFGTVTSSLDELVDVGFSALHLQGAAARDNGTIEMDAYGTVRADRPHASHTAITDRASPCELLGGASAFRELASTARVKNLSTMVDITASVSSTHKHRKYGSQHLTFIDEFGVKRLMSEDSGDTDGTCLLNFRQIETWDLLIGDLLEWPSQYGVGGAWLRGATQWPPLLPVDTKEMLRIDPDGERHYSSADVMAGLVVRRDLASDGGFWTTSACKDGYANPFLVKIAREVWKAFPSFVLCTDVEDLERLSCLIRSGIVPVVTRLVNQVAPIYGKTVSEKTGLVESIIADSVSSVKPLTDFVSVLAASALPTERAIVGVSSFFKESPLPTTLLGRGRAPYTDLVMSLPYIPFLRYGEYESRHSVERVPVEPAPVLACVPPIGDVLNQAVPIIVAQKPPLAPIPERPRSAPLSRKASFAALLSEHSLEGVEVAMSGPLELDPVYCLSQYSRWSLTRRRKAVLFIEQLRVLPCNDPLVLSFVCEHTDTSTGRWSAMVGCVNFGSSDTFVSIDLSFQKFNCEVIVETDLFTGGGPKTPWSREELEGSPVLKLVVPQYSSTFRLFSSIDPSKLIVGKYASELLLASLNRGGVIARREIEQAVADQDCYRLASLVTKLSMKGHLAAKDLLLQLLKAAPNVDVTRLMAKLTKLSIHNSVAREILSEWKMGPIMFTTPELGKWSTYGGLGVMVDDLINTLTNLTHSEAAKPNIWVVSPYYERNRKGESGYLARDNINWSFNIRVDIGIETVTVGVFEATMNGIRYFFLHNAKYFPSIYPDVTPMMMTAFLALMAKCPLEICCQLGQFPSTIVTNDWATGLTAAYAKRNFFGPVFSQTKFMHIVHNLDQNYEGRIFPQRNDDLGRVHMLPADLLVDPHWQRYCVNPSRCAILSSDNWGTVSVSYRKELIDGSALAPILRLHNQPFAHPNGIPVDSRLERLRATGMASHWDAKAAIQQKYFRTEPNMNTVLLGFVGRITFQKGVHLILDIAEQLLRRHSGSVQILIGGAANQGELYAQHCAHRMRELRGRFPNNFWADADMFFVDGALLNFGADFGLMPSAFEPGGIVQQEFMVANTPVIAFKTGGLRDTISEFHNGEGNGFTFEAHTAGDLAYAIERALKLYWGDKAGYQVLRDNARKSVVTCDMVARAWLRELYRMHAKTYVDLSEVDAIVKEIPDFSCSETGESETEVESLDWSSEEDVESDRFSTSGISVATPASTMLSRAMSRESSVPGIVRRSVRVTFKPKLNIELPRSVLLAGSFDQWASRIPLRWDKATRMFYVDIRVPQGKWQIKLIVDGSWTCIDDYPTEKDYDGNLNNVILVD